MSVIKRELQRGLELSEGIMVGKRPWSDLFVKHTFFTTGYKYYISVISASKTREAHKTWSGYVESKVRMLVQKLEQHPSIALAHAFNKGYERRHRCENDQEIEAVQEGSLDYLSFEAKEQESAIKSEAGDVGIPIKSEVDEDVKIPIPKVGEDGKIETAPIKAEPGQDVKPSATDVYTTTHYIGLELSGSKLQTSSICFHAEPERAQYCSRGGFAISRMLTG